MFPSERSINLSALQLKFNSRYIVNGCNIDHDVTLHKTMVAIFSHVSASLYSIIINILHGDCLITNPCMESKDIYVVITFL